MNGDVVDNTCNGLILDGNYIDGSWELSVSIEDLECGVTVRVTGNLPLGSLKHRIVEAANVQRNWSDYAIWWCDQNIWLLHNQTTLDQYGIQSDAHLLFRPMHNDLQIVLPSLSTCTFRVNFSESVFHVVRKVCKELSIRHSEELSLSMPISQSVIQTKSVLPLIRPSARRPSMPMSTSRTDQLYVKNKTSTLSHKKKSNPYPTLTSKAGTMTRLKSDNSLGHMWDIAHFADSTLRYSAKAVFADGWLPKPKNLAQRACLESGWLCSSTSLLEQGIYPASTIENIQDPPVLYLRFKYYMFYDVIEKFDAVRIHQIYEQARWSVLSRQFDCTEDEALVFAACQLQVELQSAAANQTLSLTGFPDAHSPTSYSTFGYADRNPTWANSSPDMLKGQCLSPYSTYRAGSLSHCTQMVMDDASPNAQMESGLNEVDELLSNLENSYAKSEYGDSPTYSLQNNTMKATDRFRLNSHGYDVIDAPEIPTLEGLLEVKDMSTLFKRYRPYYVVIKELRLYFYKDEKQPRELMADYPLMDCTVTSRVNVSNNTFQLRLSLLDSGCRLSNGSESEHYEHSAAKARRKEYRLLFTSAQAYSSWLAAFQLCSRGKTLASRAAYKKEVDTTLELLKLQIPGSTPVMNSNEAANYLGDLTNFCPEYIINKAKSKPSLQYRILETHVHIQGLSYLEAKSKYIQAWQRLNRFGRHYFLVKFDYNSSSLAIPQSVDMVAICSGRIEFINSHTGEVCLSRNSSQLRSWSANWDSKKIILDFRHDSVSFYPLSANTKTTLEFIGGYVFLGQRNLEKSQEVNEQLFFRLTGGDT